MQTPRPDRQRLAKSRMVLLPQLPRAAAQWGSAALSLAAPPAERPSSAAPRAALRGEAIAESSRLAHDAHNLFSALQLYCDLLSTPGVLAPAFFHYARDLRVLGETGIRLVEGLATASTGTSTETLPPLRRRAFPGIEDLAAELLGLETLLRALAGPAVRLEFECAPCAGLLGLNAEELLRILFNLVANAVEAILKGPSGAKRDGLIRITAQRGGGASFLPHGSSRSRVPGSRASDWQAFDLSETVVLSVRDNGPGIAAADLERIFHPGFTTRGGDRLGEEPFQDESEEGTAGRRPHGLGLAIVRHLVEGAGGTIKAVSPRGLGAHFDIELPVIATLAKSPPEGGGESGTPREDPKKIFLETSIAKRKRSVLC